MVVAKPLEDGTVAVGCGAVAEGPSEPLTPGSGKLACVAAVEATLGCSCEATAGEGTAGATTGDSVVGLGAGAGFFSLPPPISMVIVCPCDLSVIDVACFAPSVLSEASSAPLSLSAVAENEVVVTVSMGGGACVAAETASLDPARVLASCSCSFVAPAVAACDAEALPADCWTAKGIGDGAGRVTSSAATDGAGGAGAACARIASTGAGAGTETGAVCGV